MVANYLFGSSITAMMAESNAFAAISDNIANATTPGHKAQRIQFRDLVVDAERVRGNVFPALRGVDDIVRRNIRAEGTIIASNNDLHVALNGRGYFIVNDQQDGSGAVQLTDSGQFQRRLVNNAGVEEAYIADVSGNFVMGFPFDPASETFVITGDASGLQPIRIDSNSPPFLASPTTEASISANLPPDTITGRSFNVGLTIFDGTGSSDGPNDARTLTTQFTKTANFNEWEISFDAPDGTVTSATPVTLTFGADGGIVAPQNTTVSVNWLQPASSNSFALDLSGMKSFEPAFILEETTSNGFGEGRLANIEIKDSGAVIGNFTNGQSRPVGKIAVGDVVNPNLLAPQSDTHFTLSSLNGPLQIFEADTSGRAKLFAGSLENSTTDLTTEVALIIQTQRAYSSAATSLRTIEEMLQTATDLKR